MNDKKCDVISYTNIILLTEMDRVEANKYLFANLVLEKNSHTLEPNYSETGHSMMIFYKLCPILL